VNWKHAAVLVPILRRAEGLRVVLIRRVAHGVHGGQLAFPGGRVDPGDADELATALREAEEEIGLSPVDVTILERLPVAETSTTGYRVTPFLASVRPPAVWLPDGREVSSVLEVSVAELASPGARGEARVEFADWPAPRSVPCYFVGSEALWGLSFRILEPLVARLVHGRWTI